MIPTGNVGDTESVCTRCYPHENYTVFAFILGEYLQPNIEYMKVRVVFMIF